MLKDLFLSYGRRESLGLVARLHQHLKLLGYEVWFDKVNIPDGEDYAARISHGIESAHNFVYILAPRALFSPYCLIELEYARLLGKRVIPLNQQVVFQAPAQRISEDDKQALRAFYAAQNIAPPSLETVQDVLERSLALIGKTDWLDAKTLLNDADCAHMATWAQSYENQWHKHEELAYLQILELPTFGTAVDSLSSVLERLQLVLERHKSYVAQHTVLTYQALEWNRQQRANHHLLVAKERQAAEEWLLTVFKEGEQAPCQPSDLLCEFISEARKNAENRMTDCFICYDVADKAMRDVIVKAIARHAITTWRHDSDIQHGGNAEQAILMGIASADNILYFLSPNSLESVACQQELAYARQLNKRIIPLLIAETTLPPQDLQYIRCVDNTSQGLHELLHILHSDAFYYEQHKILLVRAIHWKAQDAKSSFLLRGYQLENAKTWLRLNAHREQYAPTTLHTELITASEVAKERLGTEVFLSYSRKDGDFARRLNRALQEAGKTVWFDQESISSGVNFEVEIYKGIQHSDNFLFLISPDAVDSPYCENEVNYAVQQGKRIFTVLCRETDVTRLPETLKTLQWLDFSRAEAFDAQFPELVQTLELDREHAHQHTVLQQRANEWLDNAKSRDFLLNLSACQKAETWLAATGTKQPHPTRLQGEYIQASRTAIEQIRRKEQRRQRIILGSVLLGMLIAIVLASFAWERSIEAEKQTLLATAQKAEAEKQKAEAWREKAIAQENYKKVHINSAKGLARYADILRKEGDYTRALRVAQLAYETNPEPETSLPEVDQVLNEVYNDVKLHGSGRFYQLRYNLELGIAKYSKRGKILEAHGAIVSLRNEKGEILRRFNHGSDIASVAFSSDESLIAAGGKDNSLKVWDELGQPHTFQTTQKCAAYPELECQVSDIIFPSKQTVLSINQSENDYNELLLWDIHQEKLLKIQAIGLFKLGAISYAYSDNQQYMAVIILQAEQWTVQVWKTSDLSLRYTTVISRSPDMKGFLSTKLTDDGQKLIIASPDDKQLFRIVSLKNNQQRQLSKHNEAITALAVAPDKQSFASGGKNGEVIVWSFEGKIKHKRQSHHKNTVNDLQYSDDSQLLLSASDDKSAILWSLASDSIQVFSSQYPIWIASFISNSLISTISYGYGSTENYLALWSATPQTSYAYRVYNPIIEIANSQQDKFFEFLVDDNSAYIHLFSNKINELALLQSWIPLELENTVPIVLDFLTVPLTQKKTRPKLRLLGSNREKEWLITGGSDGIFRIYDLQGHLVTSWESTFCKTGLFKKSCQFNDTTVSQMGNILVENNGRDIVVWDIYGRKKKQFVLTNLYFGSPYAMKITPDEHYLILSDGGENQVHVFDLTTGYVLRSINLGKANEFKATTQELIFLKTLSYNGKERMVMQRIPLFGNAQPIIQPLNSVEANLLEVSASGERTLISAGNKLEVWGKNSKKPLQTLMFNQNQEGYINGALFLQNDDLVIGSESNGKNYIYLWPSTKHIYEWAKNSKDIYQLTAEDKEELRMEE